MLVKCNMKIEKKHLDILTSILTKYPYQFYMFGSRANGTAHKLSDVDLFHKETIPSSDLMDIEEQFENSDLPYKVDIVNYASCNNTFKKLLDKSYIIMSNSKNPTHIQYTNSPSTDEIEFLTKQINESVREGFGSIEPFGFFIRDDNNKIIAGCNGSKVFGVMYTDQLWVHPDYRKQGLGAKLMKQMHKYGKVSGCSMATVATMSFQGAVAFYEKLGYVIDFERKGYINGSSVVYLKKDL